MHAYRVDARRRRSRTVNWAAALLTALIFGFCLGAAQPSRAASFNSHPAYQYAHITTNTTTNIRPAGPGFLRTIVINNPGTTWTVTVNDGANVVAVITPTAATTLIFDAYLLSGLSIVTAGTTPGDITVTWE
jgi:hypothetical protein